MDPISHFEIPTKNLGKMKEFYGSVFGWRFVDMPKINYTMVYTTEVDDKHMCKETNRINGGMTQEDPAKNPILVVSVQDINKTIEAAKNAGAEVVMEPTKVGDMGIYSRIKDIEGKLLGIWEEL